MCSAGPSRKSPSAKSSLRRRPRISALRSRSSFAQCVWWRPVQDQPAPCWSTRPEAQAGTPAQVCIVPFASPLFLFFLAIHGEHALGDEKAAEDIHAGEDEREEAEQLRCPGSTHFVRLAQHLYRD